MKKIAYILLGLVLLSFLIIEGCILWHAKPDKNVVVDYVVVLGAGLRGEQLSLTLFNRMNESLGYLQHDPNLSVAVSGGQGEGEDITEAEAMRRFLITHGIDERRIIKEEQSTSTLENLKFTKKILDEKSGDKNHRILIITDGFHLFRGKLLARRIGLIPYGMPSKTVSYLIPKYYLREYFAVIKSMIFDW
ncbi:YdcF family protein [Clostridiaceae bacterium 35-E11]